MFGLDPASLAAVIIAVIGVFSSLAANRSSSKTSQIVTETSGRLEAEREAYQRARSMDVQTIERQEEELESLRQREMALHMHNIELRERQDKIMEENSELRNALSEIKSENERLKVTQHELMVRIQALELTLSNNSEEE